MAFELQPHTDIIELQRGLSTARGIRRGAKKPDFAQDIDLLIELIALINTGRNTN